MGTGSPKKKGPLPIIKVDNALKLAEQWVNDMTKPVDEKIDEELEDRPYKSKLGLGAKVLRQIESVRSDDPIEQKLQSITGTMKRKTAKYAAKSFQSIAGTRKRKTAKFAAKSLASAKIAGNKDTDYDDYETESKSRAFGKRRTLPSASSLQAKKK